MGMLMNGCYEYRLGDLIEMRLEYYWRWYRWWVSVVGVGLRFANPTYWACGWAPGGVGLRCANPTYWGWWLGCGRCRIRCA